jgi:hypothetical protein
MSVTGPHSPPTYLRRYVERSDPMSVLVVMKDYFLCRHQCVNLRCVVIKSGIPKVLGPLL